jgi:hypothetical protein
MQADSDGAPRGAPHDCTRRADATCESARCSGGGCSGSSCRARRTGTSGRHLGRRARARGVNSGISSVVAAWLAVLLLMCPSAAPRPVPASSGPTGPGHAAPSEPGATGTPPAIAAAAGAPAPPPPAPSAPAPVLATLLGVPTPQLPPEAVAPAEAALAAARRAAASPAGVTVGGLFGLTLEEQILMARLAGQVRSRSQLMWRLRRLGTPLLARAWRRMQLAAACAFARGPPHARAGWKGSRQSPTPRPRNHAAPPQEVRGGFDTAGGMSPSDPGYWRALDDHLNRTTTLKHVSAPAAPCQRGVPLCRAKGWMLGPRPRAGHASTHWLGGGWGSAQPHTLAQQSSKL